MPRSIQTSSPRNIRTPVALSSPAGTTSAVLGINSVGQVVGRIVGADDIYHAVVWNGTTPTFLSSLGGTYTQAYGINAAGQVAGAANMPDGPAHAVLWNGTTPTDLGTLVPGGYSSGSSVNAFGDVVGIASTVSRDVGEDVFYTGFLYTGGTMYDLNSLLLTDSAVDLTSATGINDVGQIAAYGTIDGQSHALLLTPTPEPASAALLLGGAALLGLRRRR